MKEKRRYKFKVTEDGKPEEEKEAMSFKKLLKSLVIPNPKWTGFMSYENKKGTKYKTITLYTVYINNLSEINLDSEVIPKERLQIEEIDWAGFVDKQEAELRIFHKTRSVLETI